LYPTNGLFLPALTFRSASMLQHIARGYIHALFRYRPGTICNATALQSQLPNSRKPLGAGGTIDNDFITKCTEALPFTATNSQHLFTSARSATDKQALILPPDKRRAQRKVG